MTRAAATLILALAAVAGPGVAAAPVMAAAGGSPAAGTQLWVSRYNGPASDFDTANAVAVSPDGSTVFVTGASVGDTNGMLSDDYATVAYSVTTGAQLWVSRYNGPANAFDTANAVAVSPDGSTVFVTGASVGDHKGVLSQDYATVAYRAATGAQLWVSRYNGPGNGPDAASSVAVSPSGGTVFVTGQSQGPDGTGNTEYATVAYRAATGAQIWVTRYAGGIDTDNEASTVRVSPSGGTVFVTGFSLGSTGVDYATLAYKAASGVQLWAKRYNGPGNGDDAASSLAVSQSGGTVFVTGMSQGTTTGKDYATIAYKAASGARLWARRYNGPGNGDDAAAAVASSPTGNAVYVTGSSRGTASGQDYATVAYNPATGAQLWVKRYNGPANGDDNATALAVSPDGGTVFVTGSSPGINSATDYATVAYQG